MNIISSLRVIGSPDTIKKLLYDNIQTDDPTEEDYQLWNCKNFLVENKLVSDNNSIPYTTAGILNIFNRYDEVMGVPNPLGNPDLITTLVSLESPNESVINAVIAMSTVLTDLVIIGTIGDEYWDYHYGWIIIIYGKILVNVPIDFHNLIFSKREFVEKSCQIIHNEITVDTIIDNGNETLKVKYNILEGLYRDLGKNKFMRASNPRIDGLTLYFDTFERSAINWYEGCIFPSNVSTGYTYSHCHKKYFGYVCKIGNKTIASDFLGLRYKNFKFTQSYDISEDDYINRIEYLGN